MRTLLCETLRIRAFDRSHNALGMTITHVVQHTSTAMQSSDMIEVVYACRVCGEPLRPTPLLSSRQMRTGVWSLLPCITTAWVFAYTCLHETTVSKEVQLVQHQVISSSHDLTIPAWSCKKLIMTNNLDT